MVIHHLKPTGVAVAARLSKLADGWRAAVRLIRSLRSRDSIDVPRTSQTISLKRFGQLLLIVFIAVSVNFLIPRLLPGDPVQTALARLQAGGGARTSTSRRSPTPIAPSTGSISRLARPVHQLLARPAAPRPRRLVRQLPRDRDRPRSPTRCPGRSGCWPSRRSSPSAVGSILGALLAWPGSGRGIRTLVPLMMVLTSVPFYLLAIILVYFFAVVLEDPAAGRRHRHHPHLRASTGGPSLDMLRHALLPLPRDRPRQYRLLGARHAQPDGLGAGRGLHHLRRSQGPEPAAHLLLVRHAQRHAVADHGAGARRWARWCRARCWSR